MSILGVGELLVDAVFVSDASRWRLQEVRGGGSVWNVIANAADAGAVCTAFAAAGGDWRSKVAEADLKAVGVPTRAIRNERRVTPSIFLVPTNVDSLLEVPAWRLTPKCPVCERTQTASKAASLVENGLQDDLSSTSIVCVDRISGGRLDVARAAQAAGCSTAVDIGHRGYVRYLQRQRLEESLSLFDLIQAPVAVASMICNRLEIEPVDLSKATGGATWIVTDGPNGTQVVTQSEMRAVPAPRIDPLDPTGAGDALLGSVLADLDRAGAAIADVDASGIASAVVAAMPRVAAAISAVGGRGHLAKATLGGGPASGSPTLEDLRALDGGACVVCGSVAHSERRTARVGARSNVGRLEQRVTAATGATRTVEQARDWLADLRSTVVCGTGGSTAVAELVADLMNANGGVAFVRQPAEYLSIPIASERLLAISYSGTNKDINKVIRAAARLGVKRLGIVTINTAPPAADFGLLEGGVEVLSYGSQSSSRERGFVSIAATVAPAAIWVSAAYDRPSVLDSLVRPSEALRRFGDASAFIEDVARHSRSIEVFATGWARPAAVDFESKMTESATMPVRLHDVKDFSHGRFISVLDTDRPRLLMTVGEMTSYQSQLDTVLRSDSAPYLHLHFERPSGLGALDALVAVQHIATLTAGFAQRDLSRPAAIPSAGLDLYQWDGELP